MLLASSMMFGKDSSTELDMVKIPGRSFEMLRTEVTQELYVAVTGQNPSLFQGDRNPVDSVSWYDAIYFCNLLSKKKGYTPVYSVDGKTDVKNWKYTPHAGEAITGVIKQNDNADGYRLPTALEWGVAAKGGQDFVWAGSNNLDETGWFADNSNNSTHPVGLKKANGYGLYDMSGNVWEWCWDSNPKNEDRYEKGGSWNSSLSNCKISLSYGNSPERQTGSTGFRVVRSLAGTYNGADSTELAEIIETEINEVYGTFARKPLMVMTTEVTQRLYEAVLGENPSYFTGASNPVEMVSWYDAIYFCNRLSEVAGYTPVYSVNRSKNVMTWNYIPHKGKTIEGTITVDASADGYRLPSALEWKQAAMGGDDSVFAGSDMLYETGWYDDNSSEKTHPVAQKKANGNGLYDMCGNVWEWCWDESSDGLRYECGGSWNSSYSSCRIDQSFNNYPERQFNSVGFRLVRSGSAEKARLEAEEKARLEAEKAAEEARILKEKEAAEAAERARLAAKAEEEARFAAEKAAALAAEAAEKARLIAEKASLMVAEAEKQEAERLAAEQARLEAEQAALAAEKAREEAEKAAAEKARIEAEQAEKARLEAEAEARRIAEEEAAAEAERQAAEKLRLEAEKAEKAAAAAEQARIEAEKAAEEARKAEEAAAAEAERIAKEQAEIAAAEAERIAKEEAEKAAAEAAVKAAKEKLYKEFSDQMVIIKGQTYAMSKTEVTQDVYQTVMGENPSVHKNSRNPVENVSWYDAIYFCNLFSSETGYTPVYSVDGSTDVTKWNYVPHSGSKINGTVTKNDNANGYRLPEESEWEFAAKGGSSKDFGNTDSIDEAGWSSENSGGEPHAVAQKKANGYGLYDMIGNVSEWCWDEYKFLFSKGRYFRGGNWDSRSWYCKVSARNSDSAESRYDTLGFRVVRTVGR